MQDDDFSLFKNETRGVKPIKHDRADTGKPKSDRAQLAKLRQNATVRSNATIIDGLSDQFVIDVGPEDQLHEPLVDGDVPVEAAVLRHLFRGSQRADNARPDLSREERRKWPGQYLPALLKEHKVDVFHQPVGAGAAVFAASLAASKSERAGRGS